MKSISSKLEKSGTEVSILSVSGSIIFAQLLLYFISPLNPHPLIAKVMMVATQLPFLLIILAMVVQLFRTDQSYFKWRPVNAIIDYVMVLFMPFILFDGLSNFFHRFSLIGFPIAKNGFAQLTVVFLMLAISVPVVGLFASRIQSNLGRIITLTLAIWGNLQGAPYEILLFKEGSLHAGYGWESFWKSGLVGALAFVVVAFIVSNEWHLNVRNITVPKLTLSSIGLVLTVSIWYLEEYFTITPKDWPFPIYWHFGLEFHKFSWSYVWTALEAGIGEETLWRILVLALLFKMFANKRHGALLAVATQGILFGLWHSTNVIAGASASGVFGQVIFAASFGVVSGAIFVYTKSILISMVLHAVNDLLAFWATGSFLATSMTFNWQNIVAMLLEISFAAVILAYVFTGIRLTIVKQNIQSMF